MSPQKTLLPTIQSPAPRRTAGKPAGCAAIEKIDGPCYNATGLPIRKVSTELDKFLK